MQVVKLVENAERLLEIYENYTRKILSKVDDPYVQVLILSSFRITDLLSLIDAIKNTKNLYYKAVAEGKFDEAIWIYNKVKRFYAEYEAKVIERIMNVVRIYAYYLLTSERFQDRE